MRTFHFPRAVAAVAVLLAAAAMLSGVTPALAQMTPCDAIFEQALSAGITEADRHLRQQWAMIDGTWVSAYRLEGEKPNPFDPRRLGEISPPRTAEGTPGAAATQPPARPAPPPATTSTPLPPITGFATARDVRCNASASYAKPDVLLVYTAQGVRFQEGKGPWSAVLPSAVVAAIHLRRAGAGWTIVDRTAEGGVMPPDAKRTPPPDALARRLATVPWLPPRKSRKIRRG